MRHGRVRSQSGHGPTGFFFPSRYFSHGEVGLGLGLGRGPGSGGSKVRSGFCVERAARAFATRNGSQGWVSVRRSLHGVATAAPLARLQLATPAGVSPPRRDTPCIACERGEVTMTRHVTVSCALCAWTVCGPVVTSRTEAAIREHMEAEHAAELPPPGFGGKPRLADVYRFFRVGADAQERSPRCGRPNSPAPLPVGCAASP